MSGNKHDNGVHEIGTPETLKAYQEDTPGQEVEKYLAGIQEVIQEKKEKQKKSFMQVFQNPLKGFPYNEELEDNLVKPIKESLDERYNKKADIYDDDYRSQVKYNLRQKMMKLKKEKGKNWNNDLKDAQKHHDAIVDLDKQIEKDRKKYDALVKKNNQSEETILEAKNLMPAIQKIVDTKGAAKVGGVMLDMFTASVITQAYDKVNDANKKRMESSNIQTLVKLAQRLMGMKEETVSEGKKIQDIVRKHKRELQKVQRSNNLELSKKAEDELSNWASSNGEIRGDDEDEFIEWLDNNLDDLIKGKIKEEKVNERTSLYEVNGMVGRKIRLKYRPQKVNSNKYDGKKLSSHSTIEKSDLYLDLVKNSWDIADDCNSIAIRVPNPTGSEKDREKWLDLVKSADRPTSLIRGGGLSPSEVKQLQKDMTKAAKAFGGKVLSQAHEVSVNNYGGKLNLDKGFNAMLQAIDEFGMRNHVSVSYKDGVLTRIQDAGMYEEVQQEVESLQEGTWEVPDSYPKLQKLQRFLDEGPKKEKQAKAVHDFGNDIYGFFGDDSFFDQLDAYRTILPNGDIDPYDKKNKHDAEYMKRAAKYNKWKPGTDLRDELEKALTKWTGGVLKFKNHKIVEMPREWYYNDNPNVKGADSSIKARIEQVETKTMEEGKNAGLKRGRGNLRFKKQDSIKVEGKMDGMKLTGQEISVYFRRNKVRDKQTRKAVEIALDHGGAMNYAVKQIEKLKRGLSKNKDVQKALNYANFGESVRIKEVGFMFKEDSPIAGNIQVEGDPYIPQKKGVNKNIEKYWKKEIRGISQKELEAVQSMYMITDHPGVVAMYKAGKRAFIKSLKD